MNSPFLTRTGYIHRSNTYYFALLDVVQEDEVTEHGDEGEKTQPGHNVDHSVLQVKLP